MSEFESEFEQDCEQFIDDDTRAYVEPLTNKAFSKHIMGIKRNNSKPFKMTLNITRLGYDPCMLSIDSKLQCEVPEFTWKLVYKVYSLVKEEYLWDFCGLIDGKYEVDTNEFKFQLVALILLTNKFSYKMPIKAKTSDKPVISRFYQAVWDTWVLSL